MIQDMFRGQNPQKSMFSPTKTSPQKTKPKIDSELLQNILSGLRLK